VQYNHMQPMMPVIWWKALGVGLARKTKWSKPHLQCPLLITRDIVHFVIPSFHIIGCRLPSASRDHLWMREKAEKKKGNFGEDW